MAMYHEGNRDLQERFGSVALADRLVEKTHRLAFSEADRTLIESVSFFFLATANARGEPDCSFKGGAPGFVRLVGSNQLVYPDYDGNGMFKSLGNMRANPHVGLLFIVMGEKPARLRVNGTAELRFGDPLQREFAGAQGLVLVTAAHIFPNCPRYIPNMQLVGPSIYTPHEGCDPIEPAWKSFPVFADVVPPRAPAS
jgi:predicted pyridoxine 5'-phosphate oxidase superfamily flavin-nucleotide-binding protein